MVALRGAFYNKPQSWLCPSLFCRSVFREREKLQNNNTHHRIPHTTHFERLATTGGDVMHKNGFNGSIQSDYQKAQLRSSKVCLRLPRSMLADILMYVRPIQLQINCLATVTLRGLCATLEPRGRPKELTCVNSWGTCMIHQSSRNTILCRKRSVSFDVSLKDHWPPPRTSC